MDIEDYDEMIEEVVQLRKENAVLKAAILAVESICGKAYTDGEYIFICPFCKERLPHRKDSGCIRARLEAEKARGR